MWKRYISCNTCPVIVVFVILSAVFVRSNEIQVPKATDSESITFARDIAPIFQEKCQSCHRPDSMAPMSLLTYEESRPWARSIKARVTAGEMPPWYLDKTIGIQQFLNDISLSDEEVVAITRWVDS